MHVLFVFLSTISNALTMSSNVQLVNFLQLELPAYYDIIVKKQYFFLLANIFGFSSHFCHFVFVYCH